MRSYILSKSIFIDFTDFLSVLSPAGLSAGAGSLSCQSADSFSQSSFFNHTKYTSLLRALLRSEIKPSLLPSALQKGWLSFLGCMETFTALLLLSAACIKISSLKSRSLNEKASHLLSGLHVMLLGEAQLLFNIFSFDNFPSGAISLTTKIPLPLT